MDYEHHLSTAWYTADKTTSPTLSAGRPQGDSAAPTCRSPGLIVTPWNTYTNFWVLDTCRQIPCTAIIWCGHFSDIRVQISQSFRSWCVRRWDVNVTSCWSVSKCKEKEFRCLQAWRCRLRVEYSGPTTSLRLLHGNRINTATWWYWSYTQALVIFIQQRSHVENRVDFFPLPCLSLLFISSPHFLSFLLFCLRFLFVSCPNTISASSCNVSFVCLFSYLFSAVIFSPQGLLLKRYSLIFQPYDEDQLSTSAYGSPPPT